MTPDRFADVCDPRTAAELETRFDVVRAGPDLGADALRPMLAEAEIVLTSWGTPRLSADILGPRVRAVAHAAGTVKNLVDPAWLTSGLVVFSAASRIAWSVGEYCLGALLGALRRLPEFDVSVKADGWRPTGVRGRELRGRRVGIVGASSTARAFITLLAPFDVDIVVYDPYLSAERAAALGVRSVDLPRVMSSEIVSVHVPNVPATQGMITADLLARMPDGGVLINSSRAASITADGLAHEVTSGRLRVALDVYDAEPVHLSAELATAPNLLATPHIAGDTLEGHAALVGYVMADVTAWLADGSLGPSHVDPAIWSIAA